MLHGHANFYEKRDFRVGKVKFFCKTVHTFPSYYTLWHCCVCVISTREIAWFVLLSSIPRAPFLSALSTQSGCWNVPSRKRGSLKLHWIPRFFSLSLSPPPSKIRTSDIRFIETAYQFLRSSIYGNLPRILFHIFGV